MSKVFAVYGASGCGRSLMPVAVDQLQRLDGQENSQIVFIDDALDEDANVNGYTAMNYAKFKSINSDDKFVLIAIANSSIRQKIADKLVQDGISLWTVRGTTTLIMDAVSIAAGAALSPFVTIAANVTIGKCFHANLYSYVEHDCVIGDYVTFAPRVSCNGNIHIHDHAYIGTGAVIKQGTPDKPLVIGRGAIVGMGAVVTKDVPAGAVVIGNPARPLNK
jgi:sugar O-acyltransferase (sialic acid O-acetyltransferase NeuD family)